jgi:hypothetical protein
MCAPGGNFCPRNSGRIRGDRFARDRLGRLAARGACAATLPASSGPESCVRHGANVFSPCGRATMALSFSRCVRIRVLLKAAARNAILPLAGKRSADRRIQTESASAEEFAQTPQTLCRAARAALPARHGRMGNRPARLSALHSSVTPSRKARLGPGPRFLASPDANGRTLSGTSAASTSQSGHAPDGLMPGAARPRMTAPAPGAAPAPSVGVTG